ncbi:hypothetical protein [Micromonospora sp. KC207]|nr:hypothetical protein [Micromonospora sp. KC207]
MDRHATTRRLHRLGATLTAAQQQAGVLQVAQLLLIRHNLTIQDL